MTVTAQCTSCASHYFENLADDNSTFLKRKGGLFKKAHELSVLCSVDVAVFVFGNNKKLYEYSSADMRDLIARYQFVRRTTPDITKLNQLTTSAWWA